MFSLTWWVITSGASQRGLLADKLELVSALPAVRDRLKSPTCTQINRAVLVCAGFQGTPCMQPAHVAHYRRMLCCSSHSLVTFTRQCLSTSRFGDFRSRCRMAGRCECSCSSPCIQCKAHLSLRVECTGVFS